MSQFPRATSARNRRTAFERQISPNAPSAPITKKPKYIEEKVQFADSSDEEDIDPQEMFKEMDKRKRASRVGDNKKASKREEDDWTSGDEDVRQEKKAQNIRYPVKFLVKVGKKEFYIASIETYKETSQKGEVRDMYSEVELSDPKANTENTSYIAYLSVKGRAAWEKVQEKLASESEVPHESELLKIDALEKLIKNIPLSFVNVTEKDNGKFVVEPIARVQDLQRKEPGYKNNYEVESIVRFRTSRERQSTAKRVTQAKPQTKTSMVQGGLLGRKDTKAEEEWRDKKKAIEHGLEGNSSEVIQMVADPEEISENDSLFNGSTPRFSSDNEKQASVREATGGEEKSKSRSERSEGGLFVSPYHHIKLEEDNPSSDVPVVSNSEIERVTFKPNMLGSNSPKVKSFEEWSKLAGRASFLDNHAEIGSSSPPYVPGSPFIDWDSLEKTHYGSKNEKSQRDLQDDGSSPKTKFFEELSKFSERAFSLTRPVESGSSSPPYVPESREVLEKRLYDSRQRDLQDDGSSPYAPKSPDLNIDWTTFKPTQIESGYVPPTNVVPMTLENRGYAVYAPKSPDLSQFEPKS